MKKKSKQREEIKKVLMSTTSHPTAEWVYEKVKPSLPKISLATVYRNLTLLVEDKQAQRLAMQEGPDRFDANFHPHYHFSCDQCASLIDLPYPVLADFEQNVQTETGFLVHGHSVIFSGVCKECVKGGNEDGRSEMDM